MRKIILFSLWLPLYVFAMDPIPELMTELKNNPTKAYLKAEKLYEKATENSVAIRLATFLAFAPAQDLKVPAYTYAQFAFAHDAALPLGIRVKLARVAGAGFFNASEFDKARGIFSKALTLKDLSESDREFFIYQTAWCEINQNRPQKAFGILDQWLGECRECALRSSIASDMGRALGESGVSANLTAGHLNAADETFFADGLSQGLERLFRSKKIGTCESLKYFSLVEPKFRARTALLKKLESCAVGKFTAKTANLLARLYEELPNRTRHESLRLAEVYEHQGLNKKSCELRLLIFEESAETSLRDSLRVCSRSGDSALSNWASHPFVISHASSKLWLEIYLTPELKVIQSAALAALKKAALAEDGVILSETGTWLQNPIDLKWSEAGLDLWLQSTTALLEQHRKHRWNDGALAALNREMIRRRLAQVRLSLTGDFAPVGKMLSQWRKQL